jgi:NrS-1  polymerase HBD domain
VSSAHSNPPALSATHQRIPEEIRHRRAWCPFKLEVRDGKRTKIPYNPRTGHRAKSNNPKTWTSFEEASQAAGYDGIEYILSGEDPYFLLDLDGCRNPSTGAITPEAREIIAPFEGKAFIEASTSGKGIHVFGRGKKPGTAWCRNAALGLELYDWRRPVVFTGDVLEGSTSELLDCQEELDRLYHEYMPEHLKNTPQREQGPPPEPVDLPDEELLQKAGSSEYGEEFQALWAGDTSVTGGDHSRADYALMKHLMFWTGGDEARGIALFDRSGLARRDKWRQRGDYREATARKARMACTKFYRGTGDQGTGQRGTPKSVQLEAAVQDLRRRWAQFDWARLVGTGERPNSMRGHTCRDVALVVIEEMARHGEVSEAEGGVRVSLGRRTMALRAATSLRTVHKATKHLEAEGWWVFEPPQSEDKPGSYFMRASLHQVLSTHGGCERGESVESKKSMCSGGGEDLRAPRLRWSSPGRKARRGLDKKTRRVRDNVQPPVEAVKRLGKVRGAVVDALMAAGGPCTLGELCEALRRSRPRDLRRRVLPMLVEAGIVEVEGDLVRLADDWEEALERERARKGEIRVERFYRTRYRQQREAFRNRHKVKPTPHWTNNPEADGAIEHLRRPDEPEPEKPAPQKEQPRREEEEAAQAREVEQLVRQGMKRKFALEEVCGYLGSGLRREPPPERKPVAAGHARRKHQLGCECSDCLYPEPRYARPYRGAVG